MNSAVIGIKEQNMRPSLRPQKVGRNEALERLVGI